MPELAEVEFYRKRWHLAARGEQVRQVCMHDAKRIFRGLDVRQLSRALTGATLEDSEARAKQILFRFSGDVWLGLHLGMSGELSVRSGAYVPGKHDHFVLVTSPARSGAPAPRKRGPGSNVGSPVRHALVLTDPRMFGRVQFHVGAEPPRWWRTIAPSILSNRFTIAAVGRFLQPRRAPIKAVLLMQEQFPGIGNWMADEILWRAAIHPATPAGKLSPAQVRILWRECRHVCRLALNAIAGPGNSLPRDLNVNIPTTWLFRHRWSRGGKDPKTGTSLAHATIGGRTTCWSPARQKLPA